MHTILVMYLKLRFAASSASEVYIHQITSFYRYSQARFVPEYQLLEHHDRCLTQLPQYRKHAHMHTHGLDMKTV